MFPRFIFECCQKRKQYLTSCMHTCTIQRDSIQKKLHGIWERKNNYIIKKINNQRRRRHEGLTCVGFRFVSITILFRGYNSDDIGYNLCGWDKPPRTVVPWRQGFRHPARKRVYGLVRPNLGLCWSRNAREKCELPFPWPQSSRVLLDPPHVLPPW